MRVYWNWKSAALSAVCRGLIFLAANLSGGWPVALAATNVEGVYRVLVSGWFGALTERVGRSALSPRMSMSILIAANIVAHVAEAAVHRAAGTPHLALSMMGSVGFSIVTTVFNLFAMRRGALIVGPGRRSLGADLRAMPALALAFVRAASAWRLRRA